jgi:hypothetical protein
VASVKDPVLRRRMGAHDAARVYDAAPTGKNKVSLQGPLRKVYLYKVYDFGYKVSIHTKSLVNAAFNSDSGKNLFNQFSC